MAKRSEDEKRLMVAVAGWISSLIVLLSEAVVEAGMTLDHIHRLATPDGKNVLREMAKVMVEVMVKAWGQTKYSIIVNYALSAKGRVLAGLYDQVVGDLSSVDFGQATSSQGSEKLEVELFHHGSFASSNNVLEKLEEWGFRPATSAEILAFGATYPYIQREFPIVSLSPHQIFSGPCGCLVLDGDTRERKVRLRFSDGQWSPRDRFLVVLK